MRLARIKHTTGEGSSGKIGRSNIDLCNRQRCIAIVGKIEEVVGCSGTGKVHLRNLRAIEPEGDLVSGSIERKPVQAITMCTCGNDTQVSILLTAIVVGTGIESAGTTRRAEEQVAVAVKAIAAKTDVLPSTVAKGSDGFDAAAREEGVAAHPSTAVGR